MDLIIYHRNCPDGFCAAFVAKKKYPKAGLVGCTYGEAGIPDVTGKDVLVVDFSWPRLITRGVRERAESLLILDHHKTAEKELEGLDFAIFDMNRSGAAITWDHLFPGIPRPWYVNYVQDRDLWTWKLPNSKDVSGYVMALPHTIEAWSGLDSIQAEDAWKAGAAIRLHIDHYIEKVVAQRQMGILEMHTVAMVNAAYPNISDVGNELCKYAEIGAGWFERGDGQMQFSLWSIGEMDVAVIAKKYGGGGHCNASGFQVPYSEGRKILDKILNR
jgi:oligoribonuclease NrnB/cAMP/cGMP phosphodiesterase (DHH superfamily)